jgi:cytochrome b
MKTFIWTWPTRLFHWLLVISLLVAYFVSDKEGKLQVHLLAGYWVASLVLFRLIWGFIGPLYAQFRHLPLDTDLTLKAQQKGKKIYAGHNPIASLVMLGMLGMLLLIILTGVFTYLESKDQLGVFSMGLDKEAFHAFHEFLVNFFIGLVIFHLLGVFIDLINNKKAAALPSIFTGYKYINEHPAVLKQWQNWFAILYLCCALLGATLLC